MGLYSGYLYTRWFGYILNMIAPMNGFFPYIDVINTVCHYEQDPLIKDRFQTTCLFNQWVQAGSLKTIFNQCVLPVMTYGAEAWIPTTW